jgi:urease accessory protein
MPDRSRIFMLVRALVATALLLNGAAAFAHPGALAHGHGGFLAGMAHPLTGADHLVAMVALGVWSALAVRPAWLAPAVFVALLALGAFAGFAGLAVSAVEPMVAVSLLVLGLFIAQRKALAWPVAASIAGAFAFFHGAAHGTELADDARLATLAGMLLASAALHVAGMGLARVAGRARWFVISCGTAVSAFGAALLLHLA